MAYIPGAPTEAQSAIQQNLAQSGATVAGQQASAASTSVATPTATPQAPVMPTAGVGGVPSNIPTAPIAGSGGGSSIPATSPSTAPTSSPTPLPAATDATKPVWGLPSGATVKDGIVYSPDGTRIGTTYTNSRGSVNYRADPAPAPTATPAYIPGAPTEAQAPIQQNMAQSGATVAGQQESAAATSVASPTATPQAPVMPTPGVGGVPSNIPTTPIPSAPGPTPIDDWVNVVLPSPGTGGMPTAGTTAAEAGGAPPGSTISPQDGSGGLPVTSPPPPVVNPPPSPPPVEEPPPEEEPPPPEEPPPVEERFSLSDLFDRARGIQDQTLETAASDKERALNSLADSLAQTEKDRARAFDFDDDLEDFVGAATTEQESALARQKRYDAAVARSAGTSAADYARLARDYAQGVANPEAAEVARRAVQQAVQAARASGINRGQAAIVGGQQGGNLFSQAYQDAINRATEQYGQGAALLRTLAEDAAARRATAAGERAEGMGMRGNVQSLLAGLTGQDVNARLATQQLAGAEAAQQAEIARQAANMATTKLSDQRAQEALNAASTANTWGAIGNLGKGLLELIPGVGDWLGGMLFPDKSAPVAPTGGATYGS